MCKDATVLRYLDDTIAERLEKQVNSLRGSDWAPEHLRHSDEAKARYSAAHRFIRDATKDGFSETLTALLGVASGILVLASMGGCSAWVASDGQKVSGAVPLVAFALAVACGVGSAVAGHLAERRRRQRSARPEVLAAALPFLETRSPTEGAYAGAVGAVLGQWAMLGDEAGKELLGQLREVLAGSRRLSERQEGITRATNGETPAMVASDCRDLGRRAADADDGQAREAFQEAQALCQRRLERVRAMEPARQRLLAQQEAVRELFASVRCSVAGIAVTEGHPAGAVERERLAETLGRVHARTRAVEAAAEEVLSLRASN